MLSKKGMCFFMFVIAVLLLATAPGRCERENLDRLGADGGAPPPPIPWSTSGGVIDSLYLNADGGAPPPPIPWSTSGGVIDSQDLNADGGAPLPPPIPWQSGINEQPTLRADGGAPPPPFPWSSGNTMVCVS